MKLEDEPSEELDRKCHAMQADIARQVLWSVNGNTVKMSQDDWRHFLCAHIDPSQKVLPKIDGDGIVILGVSSKKLKKKQKCELIELMYAFGASKAVEWTDPRERAFMEFYAKA